MRTKLRCLFGLISISGLGYFIYQGSVNYIVLSLIMFAFSAFVITFAEFQISKNYEINMNEKPIIKSDTGGYFVTKRDMSLMIIAFLICCGASFVYGRYTAVQVPVSVNQTTIVNNQADNSTKMNINTASISELEDLSGIGETKAMVIIQNRTYKSIHELVDKGIIGEKTFNNIKDVITIAN